MPLMKLRRMKPSPRSLIASNDPKNWSQGIDLPWLMSVFNSKDYQAIKDFMYGLNKIFKRSCFTDAGDRRDQWSCLWRRRYYGLCLRFPFHEILQGFFCFPEIDISIPFLPGMICLVKKAFPYYKWRKPCMPANDSAPRSWRSIMSL